MSLQSTATSQGSRAAVPSSTSSENHHPGFSLVLKAKFFRALETSILRSQAGDDNVIPYSAFDQLYKAVPGHRAAQFTIEGGKAYPETWTGQTPSGWERHDANSIPFSYQKRGYPDGRLVAMQPNGTSIISDAASYVDITTAKLDSSGKWTQDQIDKKVLDFAQVMRNDRQDL